MLDAWPLTWLAIQYLRWLPAVVVRLQSVAGLGLLGWALAAAALWAAHSASAGQYNGDGDGCLSLAPAPRGRVRLKESAETLRIARKSWRWSMKKLFWIGITSPVRNGGLLG